MPDNFRLTIAFLSSFFFQNLCNRGISPSWKLHQLGVRWKSVTSYLIIYQGAKLSKCRVDKIRWTKWISANAPAQFCQIITTVDILAAKTSAHNEHAGIHNIFTRWKEEEPSIICPNANIVSLCNLHRVPICWPSCAHFASSPQCPGTIAVPIVPLQDNDCIEIQIEYWRETRLKAGDILR